MSNIWSWNYRRFLRLVYVNSKNSDPSIGWVLPISCSHRSKFQMPNSTERQCPVVRPGSPTRSPPPPPSHLPVRAFLIVVPPPHILALPTGGGLVGMNQHPKLLTPPRGNILPGRDLQPLRGGGFHPLRPWAPGSGRPKNNRFFNCFLFVEKQIIGECFPPKIK